MALEFDEMTVDTSLAQEYLKENKDLSELYEDYKNSTQNFKPYIFDGKLLVKKSKDDLHSVAAKSPDNITSQIRALASSLKQNVELITQLEYHIRNIPIEVTNAQLNLIIQYLNCLTVATDYICEGSQNMFEINDRPLLNLQDVVCMLMYSKHSVKLYNVFKETTFISHLFVRLCREAGFDKISLQYVHVAINESKQCEFKPRDEDIKGMDTGTVAVVSEDADIDSAVDKFLSVSKQAPWYLRRILVQESVYQQFKDALIWKCNMKKQEKIVGSDFLCSDTLTYNDKSFLIDPVDLPADQPSVVTVEGYRTRKEMMALLQSDKARYLSLWANDIAEINEVTHGTKSPVVWVNNLADFRGPPQVSCAVFACLYEATYKVKKDDKTSKLCDLLQSWKKLDYETRREILCNTLDEYMTVSKNYKISKNAILACTRKSFVDIGKDYVCFGTWEPVGLRTIIKFTENPLSEDILKSILNGNGFALCPSNNASKIFESEFDVFEKAGIPLVNLGQYIPGDFAVMFSNVPDRLKVVWSNKGTIFAN